MIHFERLSFDFISTLKSIDRIMLQKWQIMYFILKLFSGPESGTESLFWLIQVHSKKSQPIKLHVVAIRFCMTSKLSPRVEM